MIKRINILLFFAVMLISAFIIPQHPGPKLHYINLIQPKGWPKPPTNIYKNNPLTEEGFELGRKIFYDTRLSKDNSISCASCHQQFAAFCTYDHDFSHGYNNSYTTRNAPALFNLAWSKSYHWDGGVNHIEVQPVGPITAINEMASSLDSVLYKLKKDTSYIRLFTAAFGDKMINSQRMLKALAQFTGSIQSYNSKYDKVKRGEMIFSPKEQNGYTIFLSVCNSCHSEPLFTDNTYRYNGISFNEKLHDSGRMRITNNPTDSLKFRVPSLRNIRLTYPYMHDGRFYTLSDVIEHYRKLLNAPPPSIDSDLKNKINLTDTDRDNLMAFLYTLTDEVMTKDKRFEQPK